MYATYNLLEAPNSAMLRSIRSSMTDVDCTYLFVVGSEVWQPTDSEMTSIKRALKQAEVPSFVRRTDACEAYATAASFKRKITPRKVPRKRKTARPKK